jgi:hypothetical protein
MWERVDRRLANVQPLVFAFVDRVNVLQMLEEPERAPGLAQLGGGMIAGDEDDRDLRLGESQ